MFAKRRVSLALLVLAASCKGVPDSEVAARVNGEPILKKDFEEQVDRNMARYRGQNHQLPPSIEVRIRESVLRRMIDDMMIAQKAKELKVAVTPEEMATKFQEYKSRFRTDQAFQDYLTRSKNTEEAMKQDLERNMLRDRVVENMSGTIDVTDDEINKYYEENKARFLERDQVKASRIVIRAATEGQDPTKVDPKAVEKAKKEAQRKAQAIAVKAAAASADFAALAKESSQGPEASRGGDLGWFARGRMPPEFDNVAFNLEAGKVSNVVETKTGFEIIKVWEKKAERQRPLDEVKENIKNSLLARKRNEKRREILRDLKANAKIEQLITFEQPAGATPPAVAGPGGQPMPPDMMPPRMPHPMPLNPPGMGQPDEAAAPAPEAQPEGQPAPDAPKSPEN
jgi:parvulin-like peptidyl-prolyl isomerase